MMRIGIAGCGWAGQQHASALEQFPLRADVVALADTDQAAAQEFLSGRSHAQIFIDYRAILNKDVLDGVVICLPHQLHAEAAILASEAKVHVLVEKPLATSLADADAMISAAARSGVVLMVAEGTRFTPTYLDAARMIGDGEIGELFLIRISREHHEHDYLRQRAWYLDQDAGGIMLSGGIHDFELLRMIGGEIEHVYGLQARKVIPEMASDDTSVAVVGLASGAVAQITESFSVRTHRPGVFASVHGSKGSIWFHEDRIVKYTAQFDGDQERAEEITVREANVFTREVEHFLDCIETGQVPLTSGTEERKPLAAVLATYESIRRGERIYLTDS